VLKLVIKTYYDYDLKHDILTRSLGIAMLFGRFPAIVTAWMNRGFLTEYIQKYGDIERLPLLVGSAKGVITSTPNNSFNLTLGR